MNHGEFIDAFNVLWSWLTQKYAEEKFLTAADGIYPPFTLRIMHIRFYSPNIVKFQDKYIFVIKVHEGEIISM